MDFNDINQRGLVLLGCGKMGTALLQGWLVSGLDSKSAHVIDPKPPEEIDGTGVSVNGDLPENPAVLVIAVKPQIMDDALPQVADFGGGGTLIVSIAAGTQLSRLEDRFGASAPIVRVMPNTPAAIGHGMSALVGNAVVSEDQMDGAEMLMSAVGGTVRVPEEKLFDAVTAVSGSGPAYVFYLAECLAKAGEAEGLTREMALELAQGTVAGAGQLMIESGDTPAELRKAVTSKEGVTEAALVKLMDEDDGLGPLMRRTIAAGVKRSRELGE